MNTIYQRNIAAIKTIYQGMEQWLEGAEPVDYINVVPGTDDKADNLIVRFGAKTELVYPKDDPTRQDDLQPVTKNSVTMVVGAGLGYHVRALLDKKVRSHIIVLAEPSAYMLRLALERHDFSEEITHKRLWLASPGVMEIGNILTVLESDPIPVIAWNFAIEKYTSKIQNSAQYNEINKFCYETLNQIHCNKGTMMGAGQRIADNDIETLPWVIKRRGVAELKDLYAAKPAIVVCTGPSLERNVHLLRAVQDKCVIVAVGQALRILLAYDIKPDFACSVDFGEVNMAHYKGLMDCGVPLVALNKTYAPLLKTYKSPMFITANVAEGFEETTHQILKEKGGLDQGGSVAHMSFSLAVHLGCNPIAFTGLDLALTETSHNKQVDAMGNVKVVDGMIEWHVTDKRTSALQKKDGVHSMGPAVYVDGYYGDQVLTNQGLQTFITTMNNLVTLTVFNIGRQVFDCTEGGARIDSTYPLFLCEFIADYCNTVIDKSVVEPLLSPLPNADELINNAIPLLENDIDVLNNIYSLTTMAITAADNILKAKDRKAIKKAIDRESKKTTAAGVACAKSPIVSTAIMGAFHEIMSPDMDVKGDAEFLLTEEGRDNLKLRVQRSKHILGAAQRASNRLLESYRECLSALVGYACGDSLMALDPMEKDTLPNINDSEEHFERGNFSIPLLEARRYLEAPIGSDIRSIYSTSYDHNRKYYIAVAAKATSMKLDAIEFATAQLTNDLINDKEKIAPYHHYIMQAQIIGRKTQEWEKEIELLEKARELKPDGKEALWGLATCYHHVERFDESLALYERLANEMQKVENGDVDRFIFEGLCVTVKKETIIGTDDVALREALQRLFVFVMKHENRFGHFYRFLGDMYKKADERESMLIAYKNYLRLFPDDIALKTIIEDL